ncbi:hypothetical protein AWB69_07391 [Caballeronia udeis]|uniref:Uncharacterized protein n=1 Tax=Caballeronia udeis TaxID=1232866 RepID=A0A158JAJ9_9BURK|nr:hypothetical protein AWB69_07391 [Caballeronia udeis]
MSAPAIAQPGFIAGIQRTFFSGTVIAQGLRETPQRLRRCAKPCPVLVSSLLRLVLSLAH